MKKRNKILTSALSATTIVAGVTIAAVAQECSIFPDISNPLEAFFNSEEFTTNADGTLDSGGLQRFWELYNDVAGEGNSPISADNINFLSGVSLDYDINILSSDDSVFSFELVLTQINANILGSDQRTEIVPSAGRNSLYTLTVSGFDLQSPSFENASISTDMDPNFNISAIIEQFTFDFYNNANNNYSNLMRTIVASSGFEVDGVPTPEGFNPSLITDVEFSTPLALSEFTASITNINMSQIEINTGSFDYQYEGVAGSVTSPDTLTIQFDFSNVFEIPVAGVSGIFNFQAS